MKTKRKPCRVYVGVNDKGLKLKIYHLEKQYYIETKKKNHILEMIGIKSLDQIGSMLVANDYGLFRRAQ